MRIRFPDPEFESAFRAYVNYFEDLAGSIGGLYGWDESLVSGVHEGVLTHPPVVKVQRRQLTSSTGAAWESAMRKSWGALRRAHREVEDPELFDEEANAWLPVQAYYAAYHAVLAYAIVSGQAFPKDHAAALKLIGKDVCRGLLPYPWSLACKGCPQTGSHGFIGGGPEGAVHVLSRPDPLTSEDRLKMFLRTTRRKELDRRFEAERLKRILPGRTRRNLRSGTKEQIASSMPPTTVFDILWRIRKKASYDDADAFVLGAAGELDARRLGESLVIVTDATVAALEALMAAYLGPIPLAKATQAYLAKTQSPAGSAMVKRWESWRQYLLAPKSS